MNKSNELKTRVTDELFEAFCLVADNEFTDRSELLRQIIIRYVRDYAESTTSDGS